MLAVEVVVRPNIMPVHGKFYGWIPYCWGRKNAYPVLGGAVGEPEQDMDEFFLSAKTVKALKKMVAHKQANSKFKRAAAVSNANAVVQLDEDNVVQMEQLVIKRRLCSMEDNIGKLQNDMGALIGMTKELLKKDFLHMDVIET